MFCESNSAWNPILCHAQSSFTLFKLRVTMGYEAVMRAYRIKYISLLVLILQTTSVVLLLRYSRIAKTDGPRYLSSTAVVLAEIVKIVTSLFFVWKDNGSYLPKLGIFSKTDN